MALLKDNDKKGKDSRASNRRRRCLSGSSERPDRCPRSPPKERQESNGNKEIQEGSPTNNIIVGSDKLRMAETWENIPTVSSEVGEI